MEENENKEEVIEEVKAEVEEKVESSNENNEVKEKVEETIKENVVTENKENTKKENKIVSWIKEHAVAFISSVVGVLVLLIVCILLFSSGPKSAVKNFANAFSKLNAKKIVNSVDLVGIEAWYGNDADDFDKDDYKEFVKAYKEEKKDMDLKEEKEDAIEEMQDAIDDMKDEMKSFKIKVKKFENKEKLGKDLYLVKAKISIKAESEDGDEMSQTKSMEFVVYKNKIIDADLFSML